MTFSRNRNQEVSPDFRGKAEKGSSRRRYEEVPADQESRQLNFNNINEVNMTRIEDSEQFKVSAGPKLNNSSLFEYSSKYLTNLSADKTKDSTFLNNSYDISNSKLNQTDHSFEVKRQEAPVIKKRLFNELPPRSPNMDYRSMETDDTKEISTEIKRDRSSVKKDISESRSIITADTSELEGKTSSNRNSLKDLREEIASLDHEIFEIQKCMQYEINQPN